MTERYNGKGVLKAVENVNEIISGELEGMDATEQRMIDATMIAMDGTNKGKLGANAILGVSLAVPKLQQNLPACPFTAISAAPISCTLPVPMMNILNGGSHADSNVDFRNSWSCPPAPSFSQALQMGVETFHALKGVLKAKGYNTAVGDEGGFAPNLKSNEAVELILEAIAKAGYKAGKDIFLALDPRRQQILQGRYVFKKSDKSKKTSGKWPTTGWRGPRNTRSSRSKTAWPKMTGRAGNTSPRRTPANSARRRRSVRHQR